MLEPYRVLDLTDEKGIFCGKVLADLGAEVIQVEPPGGNSARSIPPFLKDNADLEKSLFWLAFSAGKKSITLDLESKAGQAILKELAYRADFIIESFPTGYMDSLGLSFKILNDLNVRLIMASITPFGQTGPYKDYKGGDLVASAMGGMVYCTGDPDRPPVRISADQAYCQSGLHAAIGLMLALTNRSVTGQGQYVDVSMQASMTRTLHTQLPNWEYSRHIVKRSGVWRPRGGITSREIWPCKNGFVDWMLLGASSTQQMQNLVRWMDSEGMAGSLVEEAKNWSTVDFTKVSPERVKTWDKLIGDFFLAHTKEELYERALIKNIPLTPLNAISDVVEDEQLASRDFWVEVEQAEAGTSLRYPGPFFLSSEADCTPKIRRRAPLLGEHNSEIYGSLGFKENELNDLKKKGVI